MLIKLNDGESVTIQMNHDPNENPYSVTVMRRNDALMLREFGLENKKELPTLDESKSTVEELHDKIGEETNK